MLITCIECKNFRIGSILEIHLDSFFRLELIRCWNFTRNFKLAGTTAANYSVDILGFVVELFVCEKAGVNSTLSIATQSWCSRLLRTFFTNTYLNRCADPLVFLIRLHLYEEKPFISTDLFDIFFRYTERISTSKHCLWCERYWVRFIELESLMLLSCDVGN